MSIGLKEKLVFKGNFFEKRDLGRNVLQTADSGAFQKNGEF
jgi:hypothetical protein